MKRTTKSLMGILLCLVMLCSMLGVAVFADWADNISFLPAGPDGGYLKGVAVGDYWGQDNPHIDYSQIDSLVEIPGTTESGYYIGNLQPNSIIWVKESSGSPEMSIAVEKATAPVADNYSVTIKTDDYSILKANIPNLEYSNDGTAWTDLPTTDTPVSGTVYLRVKADTVKLASDYITIDCGAKVDQYYPLWIGNVHISTNNLSTSTWEYNPFSHTLSIKGNITATYSDIAEASELKDGAAIYYLGTDALTIQSNGDYSITARNGGNEINCCYGIYTGNSDITLAGTMSVTAENAKNISAGIVVNDRMLNIQSGADIKATAGAAIDSYGVKSCALTVNGKLTGTSGNAGNISCGVYSNGALTLTSDNSSLNGTGSYSKLNSFGIYSTGALTVNDGTVSGTAGNAYDTNESGSIVLNEAQSIGIFAPTVAMTKGVITATGANGTSYSCGLGIIAGLDVSKGSIQAKSGDSMKTSAAIDLTGVSGATAVIRGGRIEATYSGTGTSNNYAIKDGIIDQRGGEIVATANGTNATGISSAVSMTGDAKLTSTSSTGRALTSAPSYTTSYTAEAKSGSSESTATKIPTESLSDTSYYTKNYVSIKPIIPTTGIELGADFQLGLGGTKTIDVTFSPENATDTELIWSSNDSSVATVDQNGFVTAKGKGTTKIFAKLKSNATITDFVTVEVTTKAVTGISIDKTSLTIAEGESDTITYTITPSDASEQRAEVSTGNSNVASISSPSTTSKTVTVKGESTGTTTIKFKSVDGGYEVSCPVTVTKKTPVTGVTITDTTGATISSLSLTTKGSSKQVFAVVTPTTATNKGVEWSSNDNSVIAIPVEHQTDTSCYIVAYGNGTATVTATTKDNPSIRAIINVTVTDTTSTYKFTYKENSGVWYYDSKTYNTFTVKCDGPYTSLQGIMMDGYIVPSSYYTVADGSTIVTFAYPYMSTLSHGRHTLSFVYPYQTVNTFIWSRSLYDPPITGDSGTAGMITALCISALAAGSCGIVLKRKKEN